MADRHDDSQMRPRSILTSKQAVPRSGEAARTDSFDHGNMVRTFPNILTYCMLYTLVTERVTEI